MDVRASAINEEMKIAAANAIAMFAREDVPDEVNNAYSGQPLKFGRDYIIQHPLIHDLYQQFSAVAQAAMDTGVARKPISDMQAYKKELSARLDPTAIFLQEIFERISSKNARVVFAEGEEEVVIRAALALGTAGMANQFLLVENTELKGQ